MNDATMMILLVSNEKKGVSLGEEKVWIEKIKAGQPEFFRALYDRHHRKLFALCYRFTGNIADAEEQLQEVFMRILDKIDTFKGDSSFSTWSHRLTVNHLINFCRKRDRRQDDYALEHAPEPSRKIDPGIGLTLEKAIGELPHGYRNILILHDQEGFKHDEIAQMMGISAVTSRSQLSRARLALRNKLRMTVPLLQPLSNPT